jgi:hypothetical protein
MANGALCRGDLQPGQMSSEWIVLVLLSGLNRDFSPTMSSNVHSALAPSEQRGWSIHKSHQGAPNRGWHGCFCFFPSHPYMNGAAQIHSCFCSVFTFVRLFVLLAVCCIFYFLPSRPEIPLNILASCLLDVVPRRNTLSSLPVLQFHPRVRMQTKSSPSSVLMF